MRPLLIGYTQNTPDEPPRKLYLTPEDRTTTNMLIVGGPGSGKSALEEWMIRGDIRNRGRRPYDYGLCLIDMHGHQYRDLVRWCAYQGFVNRDIILLNPSDADLINGFNPFLKSSDIDTDVQVDGLVEAMLRAWSDETAETKPTLERVARLVFTATAQMQLAIQDTHYLINWEHHELRGEIISRITDPVVRESWNQIHHLKTLQQWHSEVLSTENRLYKLIHSPTVRRFMGILDPQFNLNVKEIMDQGKVLLVNLKPSTHLSPANAKLFGSLLVNEFFRTAMMLRDTEQVGRKPRPFFLYIDEWQNVVTPDIKLILAQCRKFGLHLILSNQDLSQIPVDMLPIVLTCCGIKACFGALNATDAATMVDNMTPHQTDYDEQKHILHSTMFWPRYHRDKVYSKSRGHATTSGHVSGFGGGSGSGASHAMSTPSGSTFPGVGFTDTTSHFDASNWMDASSSSTSDIEAEAVSDIPILLPEPKQEVSQRTTYTLEEQLRKWRDAFMEQYQRHCFFKLPQAKCLPMHVPYVTQATKDFFVYNATERNYTADLGRLTNALPPAEVDKLLTQQDQKLLESFAHGGDETEQGGASALRRQEKSKRQKQDEANPFDDILREHQKP